MIQFPKSSPRDTVKDRNLKKYLSEIVSDRVEISSGVNYGKRGNSILPAKQIFPFEVLESFTQADYDALPEPKVPKIEWKVRGGGVYFTYNDFKVTNNSVDGFKGDSLLALHSVKPATTDSRYDSMIARIESGLFTIYCVYDYATLYYTVKTPDELEEDGDLISGVTRVVKIAKIETSYIEQYFNSEIVDTGKINDNLTIDQFQVHSCKQYYFRVRRFSKTVDGVPYRVSNDGDIKWTGTEQYSDQVLLDLNDVSGVLNPAFKYLYVRGSPTDFRLDIEDEVSGDGDLFGVIWYYFNGIAVLRASTIDGVNTQQIILELDKAGIRVSGGHVEQFRIDGRKTYYPDSEAAFDVIADSETITWENATSLHLTSNVYSEGVVSDFYTSTDGTIAASTVFGSMLNSMNPTNFTIEVVEGSIADDLASPDFTYNGAALDYDVTSLAILLWVYDSVDTNKAINVATAQLKSGSIFQDLRNHAPFRVFKTKTGVNEIRVCGGIAQILLWERKEYTPASFQFQNKTTLIYPLDLSGDIIWNDDQFSERTISSSYTVVANSSIWARVDVTNEVITTPVYGSSYDPTPGTASLANNNVYWVKLATLELFEGGKIMVIHQHHLGSIIIPTYGVPQLCT